MDMAAPRTSSASEHNGHLPIAVVGCDFRVASTAWRNRLLMRDDEREAMGRALRASAGVTGMVCIQTCNRIEWLLGAPLPVWAAELARAQMLRRWGDADLPKPHPEPYVYTGDDAALHLVRVALGLESFVRGEREIAGQLNRAFAAARADDMAAPDLNALQTVLGRAVKRVQRHTAFGARARGVHGLAVDMLRDNIGSGRVCVVGMGEIGRKAAQLAAQSGFETVRVNRTVPTKQVGLWQPLTNVQRCISDADAVIVATGARVPVLIADHFPADRRTLVVDLGTPAQVDVSSDRVDYRGLDALLVGVGGSDDDLAAVHAMADDATAEYRMALRKRSIAGLLRATQDQYDAFAYGELPRLLRGAGAGELEPEVRAAVRAYTRGIVAEIEKAAREP